jgi:chemotaxis protein MotB
MSNSDEGNNVLVVQKSSPWPWLLLVLAVAAGVGGAWGLMGQVHSRESELAAAQALGRDAQAQADKLQAANAELNGRLGKMEAEKAALASSREELARDVAAKDEELVRLKSTYDTLQDKMKAEIAKGDILLKQDGAKLRVDLVDKVLFDSGEAQISKRGEEVLQRVGAVLASIDDKQIQVSGHTDDSPISSKLVAQYPTNWELSSARAINVVRFLSEKANVPGKRLQASGYGPYRPVATNATPTGRARNRRIEILLTPVQEAVPVKAQAAVASARPVAPAQAAARPKPAKPAPAPTKVARRK